MGDVQAYGVFQRKDDNIFRISAYLQWGTKKESIGSFLLLNPGSAKPADIDILHEGTSKEQRLVIDPTMKQMIKLVTGIYSKEALNGRIYIYNLFSLRNPKYEDAILRFEQLVEDKTIDPLEVLPPLEELKVHPWICCGWGINTKKKYMHLQQMKSSWQTVIKESSISSFGKLHVNGTDFYHLRPRKVKDQLELINELLDIYQENTARRMTIEV